MEGWLTHLSQYRLLRPTAHNQLGYPSSLNLRDLGLVVNARPGSFISQELGPIE